VQKGEVLPHQGVSIEVAEAFIQGGRTFEVCEQEGHLPNSESLPLVDAL
jgi:hypothetical protein